MIVMSTASRTLTVVAKPKLASPSSAASSATSKRPQARRPGPAGATGSTSGSTGSTSGASVPPVAPPDPGTAQSIAYGLLASFGFSTSQFGCLQDLWQRESGWSYDAENPSGAYGIPQSLPGSKMAAAGADWADRPADADHLGPRLHKGRLRVAVRRVGFRAGEQLLLSGGPLLIEAGWRGRLGAPLRPGTLAGKGCLSFCRRMMSTFRPRRNRLVRLLPEFVPLLCVQLKGFQ